MGTDNDWEVRVVVTEAEYKRALNRFWFRRYRATTLFKLLVLVGACLFSFSGARPAVIVVIWSILGVSWLQYAAAYLRFRARNLQALRALEEPGETFRFNTDGVAVCSEIGSSELRWRAFDQLWRYADMWLLVAQKTQFYILPTRCLPEDLRDAIDRWMRLGGGSRLACRQCGYDLRGQQQPRCPECGTSFDEDTLRIKQ